MMHSNKISFPEVFQPNSRPHGKSYARWTEEWWRWAMSSPREKSPIDDNTGQYCDQKQRGPVWFLAGTTGKTSFVERRCTFPSKKSILFPIIVSQFSFSELPSVKTVKELISHTSKDIDSTSLLEVKVDGISLRGLGKYRIRSGRSFELYLPPRNIWDLRVGITKAVSDGFWVFLKPFPKGYHTIDFHGIEPNFKTRARYHLTLT